MAQVGYRNCHVLIMPDLCPVVFNATPFNAELLRFRAIPDSVAQYHLEGSECCLIHEENPLTTSKGVWINPHVRVTYHLSTFHQVHRRYWLTPGEQWVGIWQNRLARWVSPPRSLRRWAVTARIGQWEADNNGHRCGDSSFPGSCVEGSHCIVDEMQVLVENGWAHV